MRKRIIYRLHSLRFPLGNFFIILIFILGFTVRIYNLTDVPFGFHGDEAAVGYNAYTILHYGTDEYGTPFPVFFKSFGEYKDPIEIYSTVPFILFFGLTEFATRLPSVIYGIFSLLAIYLLTLELFRFEKNKRTTAILAMFFLAVSPWAIQYSRVAYELMPFVFFTTFGLFLFLRAQTHPKILPIAIVTLALALYSYFTGRFFIPLLGIELIILYFKFFLAHKKETCISIILLAIILIPFVQSLISQHGLARWDQTNIFAFPPKNESILNEIGINYLDHFSFTFLFTQGNNAMPGNQILRDAVNGMGALYLFQFPLIILGIYFLFKRENKIRDKTFLLLLLLFILYPTGAMFAGDGTPISRRSVIGVIPFQILSAVGGAFLIELILKTKKFYAATSIFILFLIISLSFTHYLNLYFINYPKYSSGWWGWQYGPKDIVAYFSSHESDYDGLVMTHNFNGPQEFFKFYAPNDCSKCEIGLPQNFYNKNRRQLYALSPNYIASNPEYSYKIVETIYYPEGSPAFILAQVKQKNGM